VAGKFIEREGLQLFLGNLIFVFGEKEKTPIFATPTKKDR
jgi:hypothetical protein